MGQAHEFPFGLDIFQAAGQELAEASRLFHLAEHRFDNVFYFQ